MFYHNSKHFHIQSHLGVNTSIMNACSTTNALDWWGLQVGLWSSCRIMAFSALVDIHAYESYSELLPALISSWKTQLSCRGSCSATFKPGYISVCVLPAGKPD